MGNVQANETKQELATFTSIVNDVAMSVYNQAVSNCTSQNWLKVRAGGGQDCVFALNDGDLNITQQASCIQSLNSDNINKLTATFTNEILNKLQQHIGQQEQNKQGWFATAFSFQINDASNTQEVMNQINTQINANFNNTCSAVAEAFNKGTVLLCGTYNNSNININQNAAITALTSCINQNIVNVWTQNKVLNELWQKTDQKLASEQSGLDLKWLWITLGIILALAIIIGLISLFVKLSKSNKTTTTSTMTKTTTTSVKPISTGTSLGHGTLGISAKPGIGVKPGTGISKTTTVTSGVKKFSLY